MDVACRRESHDPPVHAPRDDDGQFDREGKLRLGKERRERLGVGATQGVQRRGHGLPGRRGQAHLAPPVVATVGRLQAQRQAERGGGRHHLVARLDPAPRRHLGADALRKATLLDPVLRDEQRHAPGADRSQVVDGIDDGDPDVLELIGHDVGEVRQPEGRPDVVVRPDHHAVGKRGRRTVRIGVEDDDAVAHLTGGLREHPSELATAEDADRRGRRDRRSLDAEAAVDLGDPGLLLVRVLMAVGQAALDDPGLEPGVLLHQCRIGQQRVPERHVPGELARVWQDVAVDAERGVAADHRADEHRPRGRERIQARLRPEADPRQPGRHHRDVVGRGRDRQVDDALARQSRDRRAPDVLDREILAPVVDQGRHRGRDLGVTGVRLHDARLQALVRTDGLAHRPSVATRRTLRPMPQASATERAPHVVLIGLMGSGKTTVGRALADVLGRPFRDSDTDLLERTGHSARDLAARDGVEALHVLELEHLLDAVRGSTPAVISSCSFDHRRATRTGRAGGDRCAGRLAASRSRDRGAPDARWRPPAEP